mgnify:CR=1 FL=1
MNTDHAIETHSLTKRYRRRLAVDRLDLQVSKGSLFAFLGHNGAGKTTTIRMLLNMLTSSSGEAFLLGKPSHKLAARDFETIGYVSENHPLPEWMTVEGLLRYLAPLYPSWDADLQKRLLELFRLPDDQKIKHLSRGMRMKVALTGVLSFRPQLLLMDEPFSGLDPRVREDLVAGLLELGGEADCTIFLSSHDVEEVERLANDVGILYEGRLVLTESVESLQSRFRKIDLALPDGQTQPEHEAPKTWWEVDSANKRVRFIDSAFDPRTTCEAIQNAYPRVTPSIDPMSLREIYLAVEKQQSASA